MASPPSFHERARSAGLKILDTTCKFVYDLHRESRDALAEGYHLVFIGDPAHREVIGYTHDLEAEWFRNAKVVGVTAGSSTPEYVIEEVEGRIAGLVRR